MSQPYRFLGKRFVHSGAVAALAPGAQCAAFIQQVFSAPSIGITKSWKPGHKAWPPNDGESRLTVLQSAVLRPSNMCVPTPRSNLEKLGEKISFGTVIATFGDDGMYPQADNSGQHVGVFLSYIPGGIRILDQYVARDRVGISSITSKDGGAFDPNRYFVVESLPKTTVIV